jgi:hypothetical protein
MGHGERNVLKNEAYHERFGMLPLNPLESAAFYRLRTVAETVSLVVTLLAHGCPVQAIVAAFGFDERAVARGGHAARMLTAAP